MDTPQTHLDVWHGEVDYLAADKGGGDVVSFGSTEGGAPTVAGRTYYLHSTGEWILTNATTLGSGDRTLVAMALGTSPTDGMLLRGFFNANSMTSWANGKPVFFDINDGKLTTTAPSATGNFVRSAGYCLTTDKTIYFNPSSTSLEIS